MNFKDLILGVDSMWLITSIFKKEATGRLESNRFYLLQKGDIFWIIRTIISDNKTDIIFAHDFSIERRPYLFNDMPTFTVEENLTPIAIPLRVDHVTQENKNMIDVLKMNITQMEKVCYKSYAEMTEICKKHFKKTLFQMLDISEPFNDLFINNLSTRDINRLNILNRARYTVTEEKIITDEYTTITYDEKQHKIDVKINRTGINTPNAEEIEDYLFIGYEPVYTAKNKKGELVISKKYRKSFKHKGVMSFCAYIETFLESRKIPDQIEYIYGYVFSNKKQYLMHSCYFEVLNRANVIEVKRNILCAKLQRTDIIQTAPRTQYGRVWIPLKEVRNQ